MSKKSTRSPNYPAISLREAVSKAREIYGEMHTHPADKLSIAKVMKYGGINGASSTVISALQKFSLLEPVGDELKIPESALNVLLHSTGEPERKSFIKDVAFQPTAFADLYERYQLNPPNDNVVMAYLIKKGFNPKSVSTVIRTFRDTIEFVKEEGAFDETSNSALTEPPEAPPTDMHNTPEPNLSTPKEPIARAANLYAAQPPAPTQMQLGNITDSQRIRVSRRGYVDITFYTETEVTQEIIERLRSFLENLKVTYPTQSELSEPKKAIWHGKEYDQEVRVTGVMGDSNGRRYVSVEGSNSGIPEDEIEFVEH